MASSNYTEEELEQILAGYQLNGLPGLIKRERPRAQSHKQPVRDIDYYEEPLERRIDGVKANKSAPADDMGHLPNLLE